MKKAKIMLTSIAVLAVVGGALAFKSTKLANTLICVPNITPTICNVQEFATLSTGSSSYFTGNKTQVQNCNNTTQCNAQASIVSEGN